MTSSLKTSVIQPVATIGLLLLVHLIREPVLDICILPKLDALIDGHQHVRQRVLVSDVQRGELEQ